MIQRGQWEGEGGNVTDLASVSTRLGWRFCSLTKLISVSSCGQIAVSTPPWQGTSGPELEELPRAPLPWHLGRPLLPLLLLLLSAAIGEWEAGESRCLWDFDQ